MSTIEKYEELKFNGNWIDRIKFILSLPEKIEIETYLKTSSKQSYDDLETWLFLLKLTKTQENLFEIFQNEIFPIHKRIRAGQYWIQLEKDEKIIENFVIETMNNSNYPRSIQFGILKDLHRSISIEISSTFYYNLIRKLTEKHSHESYNLDAHLVPYCSKEQIFELLSLWSIKRFDQINRTSAFYYKLLRYQPLIVLHLIKEDFLERKFHSTKCTDYFHKNNDLFKLISKKQPKEFLELIMFYFNQLKSSDKKLLPSVIESEQKYFFKKVPNEMIQLLTMAATSSNSSLNIQYQSYWGGNGYNLDYLQFSSSFSIENYVKLFMNLYDQCKWSINHFKELLHMTLEYKESSKNLYSIWKRRTWFYEIIVEQKIGKENFIENLLKYGDESTLKVLDEYPDLTTSLAKYLLMKYEKKDLVKANQEIQLIRYEIFTNDLFNRLLNLFKQISFDVNQRQLFYPILFQSALASNNELMKNVVEIIEKKFLNEQILVLESFLKSLLSLNDRFYLEILPKYVEHFHTIFNYAFNHLQSSDQTLTILLKIASKILNKLQFHSNLTNLQQFAIEIIEKSFDKNIALSHHLETTPHLLEILTDIYISNVFPKLISKSDLNQLADIIHTYPIKPKSYPKIDLFLSEFFTKILPSSIQLQSILSLENFTKLSKFYLKNRSIQFERIKQLIEYDQIFFLETTIQQIIIFYSKEFHFFIDQLLQDEKSLTIEKLLLNKQTKFLTIANQSRQTNIYPGIDIEIIQNSRKYLTLKQKSFLTKIILNDYIQDKQISNIKKIKTLKILRLLPSTYNQTLDYLNHNTHIQSFNDILICLPARFDLNSQASFEYLQILKDKIQSSNAKYLSDAMLNISRNFSDQLFLDDFLRFIQNENFSQLGITANKELLRLLNQFNNHHELIDLIIRPFWEKKQLHQDIRVCLVVILLNFLGKSKFNEDMIFNILEEATNDEYLPIINRFFSIKFKEQDEFLYEKFVRKIQWKILDHPTSLQARSIAWNLIDYQYIEKNLFIDKIQQLSIQFDKQGNILAIIAFQKLISLFKDQYLNSFEIFINLFQNLISYRDQFDKNQNAIDNQHDLPVYHRIERFLTELSKEIGQFSDEQKLQIPLLTPIILQFDLTLALPMAKILIKIVQNQQDLENILENFQTFLPDYYFQRFLFDLSENLIKEESCPFIYQLDLQEKLQLAQWFIQEKHRPIFVFEFLKKSVFNQTNIDKQICQNLIQQLRSNEDIFVQQLAKQYTVPWNEEGDIDNDQQMNEDDDDDSSSDSEMD